MNGSNKLEYNSDIDMTLKIKTIIQAQSLSNNKTVKLALELNGAVVDGDRAASIFCIRSGEPFIGSFEHIHTFTKGDYIDFVIKTVH